MLEHGLDVFHTAMEANRVLARHWRRAEAAWEQAEAAEAKGIDKPLSVAGWPRAPLSALCFERSSAIP